MKPEPLLPGFGEEVAKTRAPESSLFDLQVTFNQVEGFAEFQWAAQDSAKVEAQGQVRCTGADELTWGLKRDTGRETMVYSHRRHSIRSTLGRWLRQLPTRLETFTAFWITPEPGEDQSIREQENPFDPGEPWYPWLEDNIVSMAAALRLRFVPLNEPREPFDSGLVGDLEKYKRRLLRKQERLEAQ